MNRVQKQFFDKHVAPQIQKQVTSAAHAHYVNVLQEKNPHKNYFHSDQGIHVSEEDADVQQHLDFYEGRRKTKPSALDNAEALMRQQQSIEDGTLHKQHITDATHEEALSRMSIPGSFQKHFNQVKIGGKM